MRLGPTAYFRVGVPPDAAYDAPRGGRGVFECRRGTAVRASGPGTHSRRTKPCQHETHVHTLAPHTHCVDTARHLMANSSCTVKLNCYSMASSS